MLPNFDAGLLVLRCLLGSIRRGDAVTVGEQRDARLMRCSQVAARKHMNMEDELMHTRGQAGAATSANLKKVIKNLRETAARSCTPPRR